MAPPTTEEIHQGLKLLKEARKTSGTPLGSSRGSTAKLEVGGAETKLKAGRAAAPSNVITPMYVPKVLPQPTGRMMETHVMFCQSFAALTAARIPESFNKNARSQRKPPATCTLCQQCRTMMATSPVRAQKWHDRKHSQYTQQGLHGLAGRM